MSRYILLAVELPEPEQLQANAKDQQCEVEDVVDDIVSNAILGFHLSDLGGPVFTGTLPDGTVVL